VFAEGGGQDGERASQLEAGVGKSLAHEARIDKEMICNNDAPNWLTGELECG
jgi:hypothetical protein